MAGFRDHPLDGPLNAMVQAMVDADEQLAQMSKDIGDFDSVALTPEEDELVFHNPHLRYLGQVEPITGKPYTNVQAAQRMYNVDMGPEQYKKYVEDFVYRADRRGRGGAEPIMPDPSLAAPAPASPSPLAAEDATVPPPPQAVGMPLNG